jgi:hypothetical protein
MLNLFKALSLNLQDIEDHEFVIPSPKPHESVFKKAVLQIWNRRQLGAISV